MTEDVMVDLNALAREAPVAELKFSWSPQIDKFAGALAKAQGAMRNAAKDTANPFFGSKYSDLASVVDVIRKPLADNGLCYVQPFTTSSRSVTVSTVLMHESGQWMSTEATFPVIPLPRKKDRDAPYQPPDPKEIPTPQAFGSAETYLRRYALSSMLGIAAEDDDGNAASGNRAPQKEWQQRPAQQAPRQEVKAPAMPPALRVRIANVWKGAQKKGLDVTAYQAWCAKVLGAAKPSSDWTPEEVSKLEGEWAEEELRVAESKPMEPSPAREPGDEAPDPIDVALGELANVDTVADVNKVASRLGDLTPKGHVRRQEIGEACNLARRRVTQK